MRIATWNVNSITTRLPRVTEWLELTGTDILCVQETKVADTAFPALPFEEIGYEVAHFGQGRWNGVAVTSRVGIADVERGFRRPRVPRRRDLESRAIGATCSGVGSGRCTCRTGGRRKIRTTRTSSSGWAAPSTTVLGGTREHR